MSCQTHLVHRPWWPHCGRWQHRWPTVSVMWRPVNTISNVSWLTVSTIMYHHHSHVPSLWMSCQTHLVRRPWWPHCGRWQLKCWWAIWMWIFIKKIIIRRTWCSWAMARKMFFSSSGCSAHILPSTVLASWLSIPYFLIRWLGVGEVEKWAHLHYKRSCRSYTFEKSFTIE